MVELLVVITCLSVTLEIKPAYTKTEGPSNFLNTYNFGFSFVPKFLENSVTLFDIEPANDFPFLLCSTKNPLGELFVLELACILTNILDPFAFSIRHCNFFPGFFTSPVRVWVTV